MITADELRGKRPNTLKPLDEYTCDARVRAPAWWSTGTRHRCSFKARIMVGNKRLCMTHAKVAQRTEPRWTDVLGFIYKERAKNSPLYQQIVTAFKARRAG